MRHGVKRAILSVLMLALWPWAAAERLARRLLGRDVWLGCHGQFLSLIPGEWGVWWRAAYYHLVLAACPLDVGIQFGAMITHSGTTLGHRVYLGGYTTVGWARIDDDVLLADHVQVLSGAHHHLTPTRDGPSPATRRRQIVIGAGSWIGANAVVMADVGEAAIVGAGSVVTRPVAAGLRVAGIPARPLAGKGAAAP